MIKILFPILFLSLSAFAKPEAKTGSICVATKNGSASISLAPMIPEEDCNNKTLKEKFHKDGVYIEFGDLKWTTPNTSSVAKDAPCVKVPEMKCRHTGLELGRPVSEELIREPSNGAFRQLQVDGKDVIEISSIPRCGLYESAGFQQCDLVMSPDKNRAPVDNLLFLLSYIKGGTPPKVTIIRNGKTQQLQLK